MGPGFEFDPYMASCPFVLDVWDEKLDLCRAEKRIGRMARDNTFMLKARRVKSCRFKRLPLHISRRRRSVSTSCINTQVQFVQSRERLPGELQEEDHQ